MNPLLLLLIQAIEAFLATFATSSTLANVIRSLLAWAVDVDGKAGAYAFVWRPGDPSPEKNVYSTFTTLYAALVATQGNRLVTVDTSLAPAVVPSGGPYNFFGVTLVGALQGQARTSVTLEDGAILESVKELQSIELVGVSSGAAQLTFPQANPDLVLVDAGVYSATPTPPIQVTPGVPFTIYLREGSFLGDGLFPVVELADAGSLILVVDGLSSVLNNSISGIVGSGVLFTYEDGAGLPSILSAYTGATTLDPRPSLVRNVLYVAENGDDLTGDGSRQRPLATLQEALDRSSSATAIVLFPGNYDAAVIPVAVPRGNLSIEGIGRVVIGTNLDARGLDLSADAASADSISSLRLRNLVLQGQTALFVDDSNVANDFFLSDGLFVEGCELIGAVAACSISRANGLFFRGNNTSGDSFFSQCGQGQISGNWFLNTCEISFDSSAPFPSGGTDLFADSNTFRSLSVQGCPSIFFGKENTVQTLTVSPRVLGGDMMDLKFQGYAGISTVDFLSTDASAHGVDFEQARLGALASFFDANPAAIRQAISMRSAATGSISAGEEIDIDLEDASNVAVATAGAGASQGTIRREFSQSAVMNIAPQTLTFTDPMPDANYAVSVEPSALCTFAITNKTSTGFDYAGSVDAVTTLFTITPTNS